MPEGRIQNYEYDDLDNISKLAEIQGNKIEETSYSYDKNSRLLLQETENGSEVKQNRFSYDLNGNQLTKDEVVKRSGNTVSSKSTQFWYDGYNQLQRVQDANYMYTEYTYNGSGLRTKKESGDKATNYIYDGGANIIMETDKDNKVAAKNIRGLKLIYRESYANSITDPTYLYYLHNAHGDVTQLLNEQGEIIKDYRYDPFGEEQSVESLAFGGKQATELWRQEIEEIDNPFRYAGEYQDTETGNYYLRARYYDSSTQRFINEDSYGVEKGATWLEHIYGYAGNNPIRFTDPTGHYKKGDENLPKDVRDKIRVQEQNWKDANKRGSEAGKKAAEAAADKIRKEYSDKQKKKNSTPILAKNPTINTTACHISATNNIPMNQVTINPNNPGYKYPAMALGGALGGVTVGGAYASLLPAANANVDKITAAQALQMDAEALFTRYESHIFSSDHIAKGVMDLGSSRQVIYNSMVNAVRGSQGIATEGSNEIRMIMNGYQTTVRFNVQNGVVKSINGFKGFSSRAVGNLIDMTK